MAETEKLASFHFFEDEWDTYEELYESFEWEIPETFNTAAYTTDRWAEDRSKVALFHESAVGREETYTFWQVQTAANRMANYLTDLGVEQGDRVAMAGSQKPEMLVTMVGAWKVGAVAVPVSGMFGTNGLSYRLQDAEARLFVVDDVNHDTFREVVDGLDQLEATLAVDCEPLGDEIEFWDAIDGYSREFETVDTDPEDPATIIYTSGTTGKPKGVLHDHRTLLGQLPGFVFTHMNMDVKPQDVVWVLPEWSWIGIYGWILPCFFYGQPVVGYAGAGFDVQSAFRLIEEYGITYFAASPTAYRMMMQADEVDDYDLTSIRTLSLGSERVGQSIIDWVADVFGGASINVAYGQTEAPVILGECTAFGKKREDSIGVPIPGHEVRMLDPEMAEPTVPTGEIGEIGMRYDGDPLCFAEYWNRSEETADKVKNGWLRTEDLGYADEDGYYFFESRKDDVILSSGYRIGPEEVEESLATHESVADAGVIGVPHETRGEIVKAYVQLAPGYEPSDEVREALKQHVKDRLAKYEYPREIEFIDELPKTTTGKTRRADLRELED